MDQIRTDSFKEYLSRDWQLVLLPDSTREEIEAALAEAVNDLIQHDFNRLLLILYRIDINENKLRSLLESNEAVPAGLIIARLIIERELEKSKTRELYKHKGDIPEEESW